MIAYHSFIVLFLAGVVCFYCGVYQYDRAFRALVFGKYTVSRSQQIGKVILYFLLMLMCFVVVDLPKLLLGSSLHEWYLHNRISFVLIFLFLANRGADSIPRKTKFYFGNFLLLAAVMSHLAGWSAL